MIKQPKYTKEQLEPLVRESLSLAEIVRKLGKPLSGGVLRTIQRYINIYQIDTSHLLGRAASIGDRKRGGTPKRKWEDILVYGKEEKSIKLRRALIESGREYKCATCGNTGIWHGKKLRLHVHHKDGNKCNNVPKNLDFNCPNCHDQTDNWGSGRATELTSEAQYRRERRRLIRLKKLATKETHNRTHCPGDSGEVIWPSGGM